MVKLAIRDDDLNFFTKVEDLEHIYKDFEDFPISFAVVPMVLDVSTKGSCLDTNGNTIPRYIGDNKEIVSWVKRKVQDGKCDVLLHGIHHSYQFTKEGAKLAEMQWRDRQPDLVEEIVKYKNMLSNLFDYKISCFVAPSNKTTKYCLRAVELSGLNFSGIVPLKFNEKLSLRNFMNYIKRWIFRYQHKIPFPGVIVYDSHKEMNACQLISYEYLVSMFNYCDVHNLPMAINVHYWVLRDSPKDLQTLLSFVRYAKQHGAKPTKLSDILNK